VEHPQRAVGGRSGGDVPTAHQRPEWAGDLHAMTVHKPIVSCGSPAREIVRVFRIAAGMIAECWVLPYDQYAFDEIWSSAVRASPRAHTARR
jgi:hypothetical protein